MSHSAVSDVLCRQRIKAATTRLDASAGKHLNAVLIDFYLWDYATTHRDELRHSPIHRIRTIFY